MLAYHVQFQGFDLDPNNQPGGAIVRFNIAEVEDGVRHYRATVPIPVDPMEDGIGGMLSRAHTQLANVFRSMADQAERAAAYYANQPNKGS